MAQKVVQYGFTGFLIVVWDVLVLKKIQPLVTNHKIFNLDIIFARTQKIRSSTGNEPFHLRLTHPPRSERYDGYYSYKSILN